MAIVKLIIGMPGSGKSVLINYLESDLFKDYVVYDD